MTRIIQARAPRSDHGNDPNDHRDDQDYVRRILASTSNVAGNLQGIVLRSMCAKDWEGQDVPPREWVWPSWLPRGTVTGLSGPPGAAKSTLTQQLCTHVGIGRGFLGKEIASGTALYVTCEDDTTELHRRQVKINAALGLGMRGLQNLHLMSWVGEDAQLVRLLNGVFTRTERFDALDQLIGDLEVDLVALDLLADLWNGNESDRQAVNGFVKHHLAHFAQRHNASVLGLFHPSLTGLSSGTGSSGSTAWEGSFRSRLYLEKSDDNTRKLKRMKANYADLDETSLVWVDGYLKAESEMAKSPTEEAETYWKTAFLTCLQHCEQKGIEVSPSNNSSCYFGKQFPDLWTNLDRRHRKITKKQFQKVYVPLVAVDGAVKVEKDPRSRKGDRLKFVGYGA